MANQLKMAEIHSILTLRTRGWSFRRIARELGVHRETVARYVQQAGEVATAAASSGTLAKPANALIGAAAPEPANAPIGPDGAVVAAARRSRHPIPFPSAQNGGSVIPRQGILLSRKL